MCQRLHLRSISYWRTYAWALSKDLQADEEVLRALVAGNPMELEAWIQHRIFRLSEAVGFQ